jgi:hypothetical protein
MALFDPPSLNYPTRWKDFSLDYKLMYVFDICMVVLCVYGDALSVKQELLATICLVAILISLSIGYRRRMNWRWPGVQANGVLNALVTLLLACAYEYTAIAFAPPSSPRILPVHLLGLGLFAFVFLRALKIVQPSKSDFLSECEVPGAADYRANLPAKTIPVVPEDLFWKGTVRAVYGVIYQLIWLDAVALLYFLGAALRKGSSKPTSTQTDLLIMSGKYVQHSQKVLINSLLAVYLIGLPSIFVIGLILHFFVGVRLFPNMTTLIEWRKRRQRK